MTSTPVYSSWQTGRQALAGITMPLRAPSPCLPPCWAWGYTQLVSTNLGWNTMGGGLEFWAWQCAHNAPVSSGHSWLEVSGKSPTSPLKLAFYVSCTRAVERDNSVFSHSSEGSGPSCGEERKVQGGEVSKCATWVHNVLWVRCGRDAEGYPCVISQFPSIAGRREGWDLTPASATCDCGTVFWGLTSSWGAALHGVLIYLIYSKAYHGVTMSWYELHIYLAHFQAFKERKTFVFSSSRLLMQIYMTFLFSFPYLLWLGKSIFSTSIFYKAILWGAIQKENLKVALLVSTQVSQESPHWLLRFKVHFENFGDFFLLSQHFSFRALTCLKFPVTKLHEFYSLIFKKV